MDKDEKDRWMRIKKIDICKMMTMFALYCRITSYVWISYIPCMVMYQISKPLKMLSMNYDSSNVLQCLNKLSILGSQIDHSGFFLSKVAFFFLC
mmetsp:Transcript_26165/g.38292  ORF Transcript_26165/g.38292 Transcript_26165/m.38292 type:complete len:94 (+) Transcript_26165:100-381(+)